MHKENVFKTNLKIDAISFVKLVSLLTLVFPYEKNSYRKEARTPLQFNLKYVIDPINIYMLLSKWLYIHLELVNIFMIYNYFGLPEKNRKFIGIVRLFFTVP